jgi:NadR type nicotinamide-nucleotide adenylyltransferase
MRIAILGPESTGKTLLARTLAERLPGAFVPEYGRTYSEEFGNQSTALDLAFIAAGQLLAEEEAAANKPGLPLVCDTDVLTTCTYAHLYLGYCPNTLLELSRLHTYTATFLLPPSLPFRPDTIRLFEHRRDEHFALLKQLLDDAGRSFTVLETSTVKTRVEEVLQALEAQGLAF